MHTAHKPIKHVVRESEANKTEEAAELKTEKGEAKTDKVETKGTDRGLTKQEQIAAAEKAAAERKAYVDKRVADKIKELTAEQLAAEEVRIKREATAIIESELRPIPGNPTYEQVIADKQLHAKSKQSKSVHA